MTIWADWRNGSCYHPNLPTCVPPYGESNNKVLVNGVEVTALRITRLAAGPNGYVEYQVDDATGTPIIENGMYKNELVYGNVEWTPFPEVEADTPIVVGG